MDVVTDEDIRKTVIMTFVAIALFMAGAALGYHDGMAKVADCPSCSCSAEFEQCECPPQNVTVMNYYCEESLGVNWSWVRVIPEWG